MTSPLSPHGRKLFLIMKNAREVHGVTDDTIRRVANEYLSLAINPTPEQLNKRLAQVHGLAGREDPYDGLDDLIEQEAA